MKTVEPLYSLHTIQNKIYVSEAKNLIQVQSKLSAVEYSTGKIPDI